ncbi:uncharacterized protein [Epargyreus clarus]|uniref:uncharacterized protein n=1 Tax=Epargyreus clarus TaxID=520877 RepID=UPI003C2D2509
METRINNTREYLSKDILEEESIKSFAPIRILQIVFGTCRVDVRHRFVTAPTFWQKCYSIFCIISVIVSCMHVIYVHLYGYYRYQNIRTSATIWLCIFILSNICNLIHSRFLNGEANAKFYVKLQKIDRIMNIDKNEVIQNFTYTISVIISLIIVVFLIMSVCLALAPLSYDLVGSVSVIYIDYSFLTELMHCSQNIYLFSVRLRFINCIIVNYLEGNPIVVPLEHCAIITGSCIFDVCLLVMLSTFCDMFLKETIKTKRLCTRVMALNYEGSVREKARKILIIIEKNSPDFSVYDMWITNSHTFLSLINVIASLTITLLQFIFL